MYNKRNIKTFFIITILVLLSLTNITAQDKIKNTEEEITDTSTIYDYLFSDDIKKNNYAYNYIQKTKSIELAEKLIKSFKNDFSSNKTTRILKALNHYPSNITVPLWISLYKKIDSTNVELKISVINILGNSFNKKAVRTLTKELDNPQGNIRKSAVMALEKIGDDRAYPRLFALASSNNPIYRLYAMEAMIVLYDLRMYHFVEKMLSDKNKSIRILTLKCIAKNNLSQTIRLVRKLAAKDANWEVRSNAINILGQFNDRNSLYVLLQNLKSKHKHLRLVSAQNLLKLRFYNSAYAVSLQLFKEQSDRIKDILLDILINLKEPGNFSGAKKILLDNNSLALQLKAAYLLGISRSNSAGYILSKGLKSENDFLKAEICNALGNIKNSYFTKILFTFLNNENKRYVRSAALYALAKHNYRPYSKKLLKIYQNEQDFIFKKLMKKTFQFVN